MITFASNADEVAAKMGRIRAEFDRKSPDWMRDSVLYVQSRIPGYPAPQGDYRRTGTLGRVLTAFGGAALPGGGMALSRVESVGGDVVGYVGGRLSYLPYVVDATRQAWMHRGRWYTIQDVVRRALPGVKRIHVAGMRALLRSMFRG